MLIHTYDSNLKLVSSKAEPDDYNAVCGDVIHEFNPAFKQCACGKWTQGKLDLTRTRPAPNQATGGPANHLKPGVEGAAAVDAVKATKGKK